MVRTLYGKLALVLFALMFLIGLFTLWVMTVSGERYRQEADQKLGADLAAHIVASHAPLMADGGVNQGPLKEVFHGLMVVNPSIEVYLLDADGTILSYSAPPERVQRERVSLGPIRQFLSPDRRLPILGDDPRGPHRKKIFSVAPVPGAGPEPQGFLYVILAGEAVDSATAMVRESHILRQGAITVGGALLVALFAGLLLFGWITGRLRQLGVAMSRYQGDGGGATVPYRSSSRWPDEIDQLGETFNRMAERIDQQVGDLRQTDTLRRELVANVSHDLRTPLTTLHGYLETLQLKDDLSADERRRYVTTALSQSQRLSHLIGDLFELARLDACESLPDRETFSVAELVQDVVQQFQLKAEGKEIELSAELGDTSVQMAGDIGMLQRALENLLENALRHTPQGGTVHLLLKDVDGAIHLSVADSGDGVPEDQVETVFDRFHQVEGRERKGPHAGLGLAIVKRVVTLHGGAVAVGRSATGGAVFIMQFPDGL